MRTLVHHHDLDPTCRERRLEDGSLRGECMDRWLADVDARVAGGQDPFLAIVDADPRDTLQGSVQLSLDLRG